MAADPILPSQEIVPSFNCEDDCSFGESSGNQGRPRRRRLWVSCFLFCFVVLVFCLAIGSCVECIQAMSKSFRWWRRKTRVATTPPEITTPQPAHDAPEDHALANQVFVNVFFVVLILLSPVAERIFKTPDSETQGAVTEEVPAFRVPPQKIRLPAIESLRFFIVAYIVLGQFIHVATANIVVLKILSQFNVIFGTLFVTLGYVISYTTTEIGVRKHMANRLDDTIAFAVSKIMAFVPLHLLGLLLFGVMFFWTDMTNHGTFVAIWNGIVSITLVQAWFPLTAETWNAPVWFVSAFWFCLFVLPSGLKLLAQMTKSQLRSTIFALTIASIVPKVAYSYDLNAWEIFEGLLDAERHPNYVFFNALRFNPLLALFEVLMGAAACRLVMLDSEESSDLGSAVLPFVAMAAIIVLRAYNAIALNDMIIQAVFFIPSFIAFLTRLHRECASDLDGSSKLVSKFLNHISFVSLSELSFPMLMMHKPIGQLFFEKTISNRLWGGPLNQVVGEWFFLVYLLSVVVASYVCQKYFLVNAGVKGMTVNLAMAIEYLIRGTARTRRRVFGGTTESSIEGGSRLQAF